ncbi:MAG TPA: hypothetical protein VGL72_30485 [Bryobacteraceae bacterium]
MKHVTTIALMLGLGITSAYAQQIHVNMAFSGSGAPSAMDLKQPNSNNIEENVAGNGTLGSFSFRDIRASAMNPQPSTTCQATFFPSVAGGAILRFQDGALLKLSLKEGGDCIDFVHLKATCTLVFEVKGGTGRFASAMGLLTYTEVADPVLFDAPGMAAFGTEVGQITGTISGVGNEDLKDGGRN